ncbi:MAG TPA: hypothetical protein VM802_01755 [Chitinophaga sp.]|uniref:hypothetical protein n=1 Tax=Chitinophaga sp. TaxID=1869181 RepID=UPI002BDC493F|nr:hypothetical protein [Chitinophaga sp.]HVI43557.1 hypothetical protein [Chitinophaga sp.]
MKEVKELTRNDQQQLIKPQVSQRAPLQEPNESESGCTTRDSCGRSNSSIGSSEDILF